ncbi:uncharacterized protein LOC126899857 [Daktulosphaira vitifoliae]|uniref:uncharacterized protein LOC126899857 n=1 Tax=Daktulosphaira vitifoliae TaxID=58002 RepID=UPI0021AAB1CF|nr:uncharacterized protein LOC126899857 [Daktulosphaira vitifoliae]
MNTNIQGSCVDVLEFKCSAFCNLKVFEDGNKFERSISAVVCSNRFGITFVAYPKRLCMILMNNVRQIVGDFGIEKSTITNFLRREIDLESVPNFLDLSCDEEYLAIALTVNSRPIIQIYHLETLIAQNHVSLWTSITLEATQHSHVVDLSWNPGVQNSLACCLSDGSLHIIELKNDKTYSIVNLPPQSSTLCLSWSPKGKQIIVGSTNGSLTQYKPELKAVKQYSPPTDVSTNVIPIKVKWISNFQFAVIYDLIDNSDEQPSLYIVNTPKNSPIEFINFEQFVIMNSEQYRVNQYYIIFQPIWNILFVGSSNCTEIGVMGMNNDGHWQCWTLETRPELPFTLDKQMYPLGVSLDLSSQMRIKQLSKANEETFLDPMPVLCVLSSDGVLFLYHLENQLCINQNICKPSIELPNNVVSVLFNSISKPNILLKSEPSNGTHKVTDEDVINVVDLVNENEINNESVLAQYLETSTTSQAEKTQIINSPIVPVTKSNAPIVSPNTTFSNVQNTNNISNKNKSTEVITSCTAEILLKEVMEDVKLFQSQLENVLKLSTKTSKLKIGDEKDKEILIKKWSSLDLFFKELNETNRSQWTETKALQKSVLDATAWIEDSKSRLFFLKNPKYKCLLKNENDEPFSKVIFDNIERTLYYIETQLTHVDDQLKSRYDNYNINNKEMKIPRLETIYQALVYNTNTVNKLKEKIKYLCDSVEQVKEITLKKLSVAPDVVQNTSRLNDSRDIGLSKLSEQLLKITLEKDGVSAINSYNIAKKYSVLSANQRALSSTKVNQLQDWLKDFKTRRTKNKSKYANIDYSKPVCSTPLKNKVKQYNDSQVNGKITPIISANINEEYSIQTPVSFNIKSNSDIKKIESTDKISDVFKHDLNTIPQPSICPSIHQTSTTSNPIVHNIFTNSKPTLTDFSSSLSKPSNVNTSVPSIWKPVESVSNTKPLVFNNVSDKFDYKIFTKDSSIISTSNTTPAQEKISVSTSSIKTPLDFSIKSQSVPSYAIYTATTVASKTSSLDVVSETINTNTKLPFSFNSSLQTESSTVKLSQPVISNFANSTPNKIDKTKTATLISLNIEPTVSKEAPLAAFNFNSKPDIALSSFSFNICKTDESKTGDKESKCSSPIISEPSTPENERVETNISANSLPIVEISTIGITDPETKCSTPITVFSSTSTTSTTSVFDTSKNSSSTIFGNATSAPNTTTVFGTPTMTTASSIFGSPIVSTTSSTFSSSSTTKTSTSSIFGTPTSLKTTSIFGSVSQTSAGFGSSTTNSSIFGTPTITSTSSIFGLATTSTSSIFGAPLSTSSSTIFGSPATTSTSTIFGAPTTTSTSSIFGTLATTNISSSSSPSIFGAPSITNAPSSSIFGGPATTIKSSIFGTPTTNTTSSIFGTPTNTTNTTSIFGSPSTTATSSGLFGSVAAAANQSSTFGQSTLGFNSPGSAFGNMSLFGQQSCSPSQPGNNFGVAANPFAINKTSTSPSSLFSGQKAVFGQPTVTSSQNSFGTSNPVFGTGSGFSMGNQTNNLGFGAPPVFGNMGSNFSNTSGFGQAPVFGGSGTFGSAVSSQYTFGQTSSLPDNGTFSFGAAAQQPTTAFASLAAQTNSPTFGNIAQNQTTGFASPAAATFGQQQQPQTSPFKPQTASFGGSSFSSWR